MCPASVRACVTLAAFLLLLVDQKSLVRMCTATKRLASMRACVTLGALTL